jgi:hypothetical protein
MKKILSGLFLFPVLCFSQLLNGGMENYTFTADTIPTDWTVDSYWSTKTGRTADASGGNFSFVINTWYSYAPGMMVNGTAGTSLLFDWVKAGTPINYKPALLTGYYKYIDTVYNDSAIVKVLLKKWNTALNKIDSVAFGIKKLPFANSWTQFDVEIEDLMPGQNPDSLVVFFMTFDYLAGVQPICQTNECRYLYIDDLSLNGTIGLQEIHQQNPNDFFYSGTELNVQKNHQGSQVLEIFSVEGKLILARQIIPGSNKIDLSSLPPGFYVVRSAGSAKSVFKFVKTE